MLLQNTHYHSDHFKCLLELHLVLSLQSCTALRFALICVRLLIFLQNAKGKSDTVFTTRLTVEIRNVLAFYSILGSSNSNSELLIKHITDRIF